MPDRDRLYDEVVDTFGAAIERLARSYELDAHKRQDLLQNIHLNLWRSFERFNGQFERQSPLERFMASHEQWTDRQGD